MSLKDRLAGHEPLIGTFLKTPSPMICEVLGRSDLDLVCIDAEHSPFDRRDIDACIYALSHSGLPSLVRVPANRPEHILNALDCGAAGILAPHIITGDDAEALANNAHYGSGRGYAGSTRAAGYGARKMVEHMANSAQRSVTIAQIEDAEALANLHDIFAVEAVDAFFIGRADLTVSLGYDDPNAPAVIEAVEEICAAAKKAGATLGLFTANLDEVPHWMERGASLFLLGSDHGFLLQGARSLTDTFRKHC